VIETKKKNIIFVKRAKIVRFCKKLITIYYRFCHKWCPSGRIPKRTRLSFSERGIQILQYQCFQSLYKRWFSFVSYVWTCGK